MESSMIYRKGADPNLDAAFADAEPFAKVKLSAAFIFWRKGLRWHVCPLTDAVRAWRRVEEVSSKTGCCSNDFSIHSLLLLTASGEQIQIPIGEALYRHEPEALLNRIHELHPEFVIGKP